MALSALLNEPASLVCLARRPPGEGTPPGGRGREGEDENGPPGGEEVVLRVFGALAAESLLTLHAALDTTVGDVKEALERFRGIPVREQRLVVAGRGLFCDGGCREDAASGPAEAAAAASLAGAAAEARELGTVDHRSLMDALGPGVVPGEVVDLMLVRIAPDWAALREGLQDGTLSLEGLDDAAREDRELVLVAVGRSGRELAFAAEQLRADQEVVLAATLRDPLALEFAAPALCDDRPAVLQAVRRCGQALQHASARLRRDREVVMAAMASSWRALAFADEDLKSDRAFILAAVSAHGSALSFASRELQSDREVVFQAVRNSGWALSCASEPLRSDRECVLAAVLANPAALDFAAEGLRTDPTLKSLADRSGGRRDGSAPCGLDAAPPCAVL